MPRILLIEDNEESRDALSRRLERRGYDVVLACDGEQGVAKAKSDTPDLVLMDMNMPILDGWQAARIIKANESTRNLPIIGLTAHAMSGDREKALSAGCIDYHTKPVDFVRLMAQIEAALKEESTP
jgi:two-component system cell cycle response regulator DivK